MKKILSTAVILTTIMMLTVSCNETTKQTNESMTVAANVADCSDENGTNN